MMHDGRLWKIAIRFASPPLVVLVVLGFAIILPKSIGRNTVTPISTRSSPLASQAGTDHRGQYTVRIMYRFLMTGQGAKAVANSTRGAANCAAPRAKPM